MNRGIFLLFVHLRRWVLHTLFVPLQLDIIHRGLSFKIVAVGRHPNLLELARKFGADETINTTEHAPEDLHQTLDVVYDTTVCVAPY